MTNLSLYYSQSHNRFALEDNTSRSRSPFQKEFSDKSGIPQVKGRLKTIRVQVLKIVKVD